MKRTLCLFLSTLLVLSMSAFMASAEVTIVTATVDGMPLTSGGSIPAISVVEFTLPNAITASQLTTAVTFEEIQKGRAAAGWATRLYKGVVAGNILTVTFAEGDLAMNSEYRFTFKSPAVTGEDQEFTFLTTPSGAYYINDNFDRYPENSSITAPGCDTTELDAPWWLGKKQYGRVIPSFVKENGDTVLRINSAGNDWDMEGAVSFDNAYAPAVTGLTTHKTVTEVSFTVQGNSTSVFEIGGIIIRTKNGQTGLYYRSSGLVNASQVSTRLDDQTVSLNYPVAAPTAQKVMHTIKFIQTSNCAWPQLKSFQKIWFDGNEVPLPAGGITSLHWDDSSMTENPVNYQGGTGLAHVLSATNKCVSGSEAAGEYARTIMDVHSFKYSSLVGVSEIITEGSPQFAVDGDITVMFSDTPADTNPASLANHITIEKIVGGVASGSLITYAIDYDANDNAATLTPVVPLENNAEYKVTVSGIEFEQIGVESSFSKNFITTWEKLDVSTDAIAATADGFAPTVSVANNSGAAVTYTTRLALYKVENGRLNQVAYVDKNDHNPIAAGETQSDVSLGTVSDPSPSESATYFARVFFLESGNIVANKIIIGTEPASAVSTVSGSTSAITFTPAPNVNTGRIDVQGQYVGGLANYNRGLWVTVTDPSGNVIYNDQFTSGTAGRFAFGFNLVAGNAENGDYSVVVKPSDTAAFGGTAGCGLLNLNFDVVTPEVTALEVTGNGAYGETLTADYEIFDFVGRSNVSVVTWKVGETESGPFSTTVATGTDLTTYTVPADYIGKYLTCVVTPKVTLSGGGTSDGEPRELAESIYLKSSPEATNVVISQAVGSNTISLTYSINDPLGHDPAVPARKVTWRVKNADGTDAKVLVDHISDIYTVLPEDNGKTIQAEVTPVMSLGTTDDEKAALAGNGSLTVADVCKDTAIGPMVISNVLTMTYTATNVDTTIGSLGGNTGGGGGAGGGGVVSGAGNPAEEDAPPVYQSPDESTEGVHDLPDARGHWAEKEIFTLYDKGIITGRDSGEFDPEGNITRSEFVAILVRAMGLETKTYTGGFKDVTSEQWYADILATAKEKGLLEGNDGYANPDKSITREEMVQIIVRAYEEVCGEIEVGGGLLDFADARSISVWARTAVVKATEISLVNGTGDGKFSPVANTTRAQAAVIISRLISHLEAAAQKNAEEEATEDVVIEETEKEEAVTEETMTETEISEEETKAAEDIQADTEVAQEETDDTGAEEAPAEEA